MSERPQPPSPLTDVEALRNSVQSNPKAWFDYFVAVDSYTRDLASGKATLTKSPETVAKMPEVALGTLRAEKQPARDFLSNQTQAVQKPAVQAPAVQIPAAPAPVRLSERVPDPEPFHGSLKDLRRFENEVIQKLETNFDRYPTPQQRVTYVMRLCKSAAQRTVQATVLNGKNSYADYQDVLAHLRKAYGNSMLVQLACDRLCDRRQGPRENYNSFITDFERLAFEADMDLTTLAPFLERAVTMELRHKVPVTIDIPSDYYKLSALYQKFEKRRA